MLIRRQFTNNETVLQTIQKHSQRLLGHEDDGVIIGSLHLRDILEIGCLQAAPFLVPHAVDRKGHVFRGERRAVMKFDVFF